jgi:hypothetical protein
MCVWARLAAVGVQLAMNGCAPTDGNVAEVAPCGLAAELEGLAAEPVPHEGQLVPGIAVAGHQVLQGGTPE